MNDARPGKVGNGSVGRCLVRRGLARYGKAKKHVGFVIITGGGAVRQQKLFDSTPTYRKTDPRSSKNASDEVIATGKRAAQQHFVLEMVRRHPFSTSLELSRCGNLDRYQVARRLPELERAGMIVRGPIRVCRVGGRNAQTWVQSTCKGDAT